MVTGLEALLKQAGVTQAVRDRGLGPVLGEYGKHMALNAGQAARDARYLFDHPDAGDAAETGNLHHNIESVKRRLPSFGRNAFYAVIPPHWHHTDEDLKAMGAASAKDWFLHGYNPWDHPDPLAHLNAHLPAEEPRPASHSKEAGVLAHIAGPTAAGKTTLLRQLKKEMPGLTTQDLDQFYFRARANLKDQLPASSSDWTDEHRAKLDALRKSKFDAWLGEHQAEPIVLGGHNLTDGAETLKIPGGKKFLLDTGAATSAVRRYRRSQGNKDETKRQSVFKIPSSWMENRKEVGHLKALGYQPLGADKIVERIRQLT